ncbi:MAG: hypothetical protein DRN71_04040 [Candidatus Nanohalarchaeota archaeon]|nr:MAG: hypothetical protein DRN71_04040 [Candidatus Nanohaloarchaeota archaeon]
MFTVVLVEPESDGNIGFVARVMKNFGVKDLVLVNPKAPLTDDVKAYSMHGYDVYEQSKRVRSVDCLGKFDVVVGFSAKVGCGSGLLRHPVALKELSGVISGRNAALVFGRESNGLSNDELLMCDIISTIPAVLEYPTMNLSHAVCVVLYELAQEVYCVSPNGILRGTSERLLECFNGLVDADSFKNPDTVKLAFRRIIAKSDVTEKEAKAVLTLFSKLSAGKG